MIEIAGYLEIPNNSVYRITSTLVSHKYLIRNDQSKRFRLSRKFLALGYASINEKNVVEMSVDIMRQLRDEVKETVLLATFLGDAMVVLEQVPSTHPFKFMLDAGSRVLLHTSAPGKALLAFLPESEQKDILSRLKLTRFNDHTITRKPQFKKELQQISKHGYACGPRRTTRRRPLYRSPDFKPARLPHGSDLVHRPERACTGILVSVFRRNRT